MTMSEEIPTVVAPQATVSSLTMLRCFCRARRRRSSRASMSSCDHFPDTQQISPRLGPPVESFAINGGFGKRL